MTNYKSKYVEGPDHLYYNIQLPHNDINNPLAKATDATFHETRSVPILTDAKNYYASIVRFTCPANSIPIQLVPTQPFPNINPNLTPYSVTLVLNNTIATLSYQTFVIYVPTDLTQPVPPAPTPDEGAVRNKFFGYYSLFSYQALLDMFNTALQTSFTALKTANVAIAQTEAPFFTLDSKTNLITLWAPSNYIGGVDTIQIYVNNISDELFHGSFKTNYLGEASPFGTHYQYIIENTQNNFYATVPNNTKTNYYGMLQEFDTLSLWLTPQAIVFTSNQLGPQYELTPNITTNSSLQASFPSNNFNLIVTDIELASSSGLEFRNSIHYLPTAQYRYFDLKTTSIQNMDMTIYWVDNYNNYYIVKILPHQVITMKILFIKKDLIKNYKPN